MLKIKNNVDLKKLEKYGLKLLEGYDNEWTNCYTDLNIEVNLKNKCISNYTYMEMLDLDMYQDTLYDLIKADLVEKIDNE